jgi:hypothetical protein
MMGGIRMALTRYSIGDRLYASCYSDFEFGVEVQIQGISNLELASEYEDVLRKLFNSDKAQANYETLRSNTSYFYICKVIRGTVLYKENDKIVLCDSLIKENESYYIEESVNLQLDLSFNTQTSSYRYKQDLITDLNNFFETRGVTGSVKENLTEDDLREAELDDLRSLIVSLKQLKGAEKIVDKLLQVKV